MFLYPSTLREWRIPPLLRLSEAGAFNLFFLSEFSFWSLTFWSLYMIYQGGVLLAFTLLGVLWAFWVCGLMSNINVEKILCHSCLKYCLCSCLSFPSGIPVTCIIYLHSCLTVPGYTVLVFSLLFSLLFSFGNFYCYILKFSDSFLSHVQLLRGPSKVVFISVLVFFISNISFFILS